MTHPPAGWYPDPQAPSQRVRWWDGGQWTHHEQTTSSGPRTDDGEELAGWWQRAGQYLIDTLVVQAAMLPFVIPAQISMMRDLQPILDDAQRRAEAGRPVDPWDVLSPMLDQMGEVWLVIGLAGLVVWCLYVGLMLRWRGQTLGMMALSLHVRPVDAPGRLPWSTIGRRLLAQFWVFAAYLLPGIAGFIGVAVASLWAWTDALWAAGDRRRQTLHDKFAGTLLVRRD